MTGNVGSAGVKEGAASVEYRAGYSSDSDSSSKNDRFEMRQHVDYGVNDWYAVRLITAQNKSKGDNLELKDFKISNRFQFFDRNEEGWDGGIRLIYTHADGDKKPGSVELRGMAQIPFAEKWEYRHNLMWSHDVGEDSTSGLELQLRHRITYSFEGVSDVMKIIKVGADMINNFGRLKELNGYSNQEHVAGPMVYSAFENGAYIQAGYRRGLSKKAANNLVKFDLGYKF